MSDKTLRLYKELIDQSQGIINQINEFDLSQLRWNDIVEKYSIILKRFEKLSRISSDGLDLYHLYPYQVRNTPYINNPGKDQIVPGETRVEQGENAKVESTGNMEEEWAKTVSKIVELTNLLSVYDVDTTVKKKNPFENGWKLKGKQKRGEKEEEELGKSLLDEDEEMSENSMEAFKSPVSDDESKDVYEKIKDHNSLCDSLLSTIKNEVSKSETLNKKSKEIHNNLNTEEIFGNSTGNHFNLYKKSLERNQKEEQKAFQQMMKYVSIGMNKKF